MVYDSAGRGRATKGRGLRARVADETGSFSPFAGRGGASRLTNSQAGDLAEWQGYKAVGRQLRGQEIFRRGRNYIVQDIDSHSGGIWKMARSPEALGKQADTTGYV